MRELFTNDRFVSHSVHVFQGRTAPLLSFKNTDSIRLLANGGNVRYPNFKIICHYQCLSSIDKNQRLKNTTKVIAKFKLKRNDVTM